MPVAEIATPLPIARYDDDGDPVYEVTAKHTINDVVRHLVFVEKCGREDIVWAAQNVTDRRP